MTGLAHSIWAVIALLPAALIRWRPHDARDRWFFAAVALAVIGPALEVALHLHGPWNTSFAMSLWLTIAVTMLLFLGLMTIDRPAWRLTPLLVPYLLVLGLIATVWQRTPERPMPGSVPQGWLDAHIVFAIVTYGLVTLGAVAGFAVLLQENALKTKRPTSLTQLLPAIAEAEGLEVRLLIAAEAVLTLGLLSGVAAEHFLTAGLSGLDHKIVFSLAAFLVLGGLLLMRWRTGIRGRRAARWALLAYLLLTLAYPGVKFVTDILMA